MTELTDEERDLIDDARHVAARLGPMPPRSRRERRYAFGVARQLLLKLADALEQRDGPPLYPTWRRPSDPD